MPRQKAPVTALTLTRRINRILAPNGQKIAKTRQSPPVRQIYDLTTMEETIKAWQNAAHECSCYCVTNRFGSVIEENVNLEEFARATGVLKQHEYIIDVEPDIDSVLAKGEKVMMALERTQKKLELLKKQYERRGMQIPPLIAWFFKS